MARELAFTARGVGYAPLTMNGRGPSLLTIAYLAIGVIIAADHHYFHNVDHIKTIAEAVLAVIAWPLVALGVSMRF